MTITQVYPLVNSALQEVLGEAAVLNEDLSNVVDVGTVVFDNDAFDPYSKALVNQIGKMIFVNRVYKGSAPSVLRDGWEYGSILAKVSSKMPKAVENESWELVDGASYDPFVFNRPVVNEKFFNLRTTFEIDRSITERQVRQSFTSPTELAAFTGMLFNEVEKALTASLDNLVMRTINNFTAETIYDAYGSGAITGAGNTRAINLLSRYNTQYSKSLTAAKAVLDPDFIRYAAYTMRLVTTRMAGLSTLFNVGGEERFTPSDLQHIVMLADFKAAADVFLQSDTFHDEYTKLANAEVVPYWQGTGTGYSFADVAKVDVTTASGHERAVTGVLAVAFDHDALGVCNESRRVTTQYNAKAEFTNYFYKQEAGYFNDLNENFVVFFVA